MKNKSRTKTTAGAGASPALATADPLADLATLGRRELVQVFGKTDKALTRAIARATERAGFPAPVIFGERNRRWLMHEVAAWVAARPRAAKRPFDGKEPANHARG